MQRVFFLKKIFVICHPKVCLLSSFFVLTDVFSVALYRTNLTHRLYWERVALVLKPLETQGIQ